MNKQLRRNSDLLVITVCYVVPLFYSWSYSPVLTAILAGIIFSGLVGVICLEDPFAVTWLPKVAVGLLCFKAFILSMMAVPHIPAVSLTLGFCYLGYLFVALGVVWNGSDRMSEISARFENDVLPGRMKAIECDLHSGCIDQEQADQKRALLAQDGHFYAQCDGVGWCLRYEVVGTFLCLIILGINEPVYILGHLFMTFLMSISLGMMVARSSADNNLS